MLVSFRIGALCLAFCLFMVLVLMWFPLEESSACHRNRDTGAAGPLSLVLANPPDHPGDHFMCLLIPFRDRFEELNEFVPSISEFLKRQSVAHAIFVINQVDTLRFNRASLINAGFLQSEKELKRLHSPNCDYVALHDVDLLPMNSELPYKYPEDGPFHVAAPGLHPKYDYPTFLGGILLISREHYRLVNGMSNRYWGWGLEDDEFHRRLLDAGLKVRRPTNITTGKEVTFKHFHAPRSRKRDMIKCYDQHEVTRRRDRETGLESVIFTSGRVYQNCVDDVPYTLLNIILECDRSKTPWCDCRDSPKREKPKNLKRDEDVIVPILKKRKKKQEALK